MERPYSTTANDSNVEYFTGIEIEKTPAHNMKTLFVVGLKSKDEILDQADKCGVKHIYLGANQSYTDPTNEGWYQLVNELLKNFNGYITLDIDHKFIADDISYLDWVGGLCEYDNFIPMISVKMPYIGLFNYNTTIKIDDIGFKKTNPGVWCHSVHDLMCKDAFTPWHKYESDEIVSKDT